MPALSKSSLKALWTNFFQPTSADFADLISSWTDYYAGLETLTIRPDSNFQMIGERTNANG